MIASMLYQFVILVMTASAYYYDGVSSLLPY